MKNDKLIYRLKNWLKQGNNTCAKMATLLGYKTSTSINMWIARGEVPHYQQENVERIISSTIKESLKEK